MNTKSTILTLSTLLASTAIAPSVLAQDASAEGNQVMAVFDRARPDYDAPGIRTGSFLFKPSIEAGGKFDSNIYAQDKNSPAVAELTDDFIAIVKPSFTLMSNWGSGSMLQIFANADLGRNADNGGEDYDDFSFGFNGTKVISRGMSITAAASYKDGHEDRGAPDSNSSAVKPTPTKTTDLSLGFKRDVSVLSVSVNGSYVKMDFEDVAQLGGDILNNSRRDRDRIKGQVRFGYELADGYEAFVRGTMDRVEYDEPRAPAVVGGTTPTINRNSDGFEIVGGASFDLTGKVKGEIFAGYLKRSFDSDTLGEVDGVGFGAQILWNPTGLTSFTGGIQRSIDETSIGVASGTLTTTFFGRVEHELRRNVLLFGEGSYTKQDYQNIVRDDDIVNLKVGGRYLLNRNVHVNVGYNYGNRNTTAPDQDYVRHSFMVNVKAQW